MTTAEEKTLAGQHILIVDDEPIITMLLEDLCTDAGAECVCAYKLSAGLSAADDESLTLAVLDVRLGQETSELIAEKLTARQVPILFFNGQPLPANFKVKFPEAAVLLKPAIAERFLDTLNGMLDTNH